MSIGLEIKFRNYDIDTIVHHYDVGSPGVISGPVEQCYPPEASILEFSINTDNDLLNELLLEHHEEEIEELVIDAIEQDKIDSLEEAADAQYDRMRDEGF